MTTEKETLALHVATLSKKSLNELQEDIASAFKTFGEIVRPNLRSLPLLHKNYFTIETSFLNFHKKFDKTKSIKAPKELREMTKGWKEPLIEGELYSATVIDKCYRKLIKNMQFKIIKSKTPESSDVRKMHGVFLHFIKELRLLRSAIGKKVFQNKRTSKK